MSAARQRKAPTAGMIRAAGKVAPAARPELPLLLKQVAEAFTRVLASYAAAPFRCEPDGVTTARHEVPLAGGESLKLVSPRGPIAPAILADRAFLMGLCEAGFGGSGTEQPYDANDRPYSRTETRLLTSVLQDFGAALTHVLDAIFNTSFTAPDSDGKPLRPSAPHLVEFITGRILVHVFGYSGEVTLLLPEAEVTALLAACDSAAAAAVSAESQTRYQAAVLDSRVELTVRLPPEQMLLSSVANLRPGQLLKFAAGAQTPVEITADSVGLFRARLGVAGETVTLEIIEG